ncbi:MAG: class B sortase [Eubacteriales bacterium]|nr:class B sortase [Eubacteriales bacterium]
MNTSLKTKIAALISTVLCVLTVLSISACTCTGNLNPTDYSQVKPEATVPATTATDEIGVLVQNPIDFQELRSLNSDLYAWIEIPDTNINYPVAQSSNEDDNYYLHHNYLGNYEFAGTIYSQRHNSKYFRDPVTVLYGHNMLNGSMFADLHKFSDEDFFKEHDTMYIYTDGHIFTYKIFAAFEYDDRHILNSFDFADKSIFESYLNDCLNPHSLNANVREGVTLTTDDCILVLSTCTNYNSNLRYLVQGVLTDDQRTN